MCYGGVTVRGVYTGFFYGKHGFNWNNNKNNIILQRFLCTTYQRHPRDSCHFSFRCLSKGRRSGVYNESLMGEESEIFDPDC